MSASFECRQRGFNLEDLSKYFGLRPDGKRVVGVDTLKCWEKNKRPLFDCVLDGATEGVLKMKGICTTCKGLKRVPSLVYPGKIIDCPVCARGILNESL